MITYSRSVIRSNERSEDSSIGLEDFSEFFRQENVLKCSNNYSCAFIHISAFMNALRSIYTF